MPDSGIPWDYAYQYLSGGVNTGAGWETWNTNGQFPLLYARNAASKHYIPVFSYYEMVQTSGPCGAGCDENRTNLANLNSPSTMASYYQNFALLMKRLGSGTYDGIPGFGSTAIVHVEPDLSGYAQAAALRGADCFGFCTGQGNAPSLVNASVRSSGMAELDAYPDTYQGFNWALLHLRDLYAPNVLLALHVSDWATGQDIGSSSDPNLNAGTLGTQAGSFAAASGAVQSPAGTSTYDLIFNDPSDRDAGYYQAVRNDPSRWWDRLNVTFPNFHRWEEYVSAVSRASGDKPVVVWQVPLGNQYFATNDNSLGHYQDNRAEYFFGHISELVQAGVVGVMFGAGSSEPTHFWDARNDNVTNPRAICTNSGLSRGQICNTHLSSVPDDDGGYVRMQGHAYYAAHYALNGGGTPPTVSPTSVPTMTPTSVPTMTPTSVPTMTPTSVPTASPSASPTPAPTSPTITFEGLSPVNTSFSGVYPTNLIDWGTGAWYLSGPWRALTGNSVSFAGATQSSGSFTFVSPRRLVQVDAFNGDSADGVVTLACGGQPTVQVSLAPGETRRLATNWAGACTTVTLSASNGWNTNFTNFVVATP